MDAARDVSALKMEAATRNKQMAATYDARLNEMREETGAEHKAEVHALEQTSSAQIQVTF